MKRTEHHFEGPNLEDTPLGRELNIPSRAILKEAPARIDFSERHYELLIGIGKGHTASLILSESALQELKAFKNEVSI